MLAVTPIQAAEWRIERHLYSLSGPAGEESSSDVRRFDFEVVPPLGPPPVGAKLNAYALFYACVGETGERLYRRVDFEVPIPLPDLGSPDGERDDR